MPRYRSRDLNPVGRDTDFMTQYDGLNPLLYQITVCPHCFYAEKYTQFEKALTSPKKAELEKQKAHRAEIAKDFFQTEERNFANAVKSYELAAQCSLAKKAPSEEVAGHYLRAAWLGRQFEHPIIEEHYLTLALEYFKKAYFEEDPKFGKLGEVGYLYVMGELARRLKKYDEALKYFARVIEHPEIERFAEVERLTRDAWQLTKEERNKNKKNIEDLL